MKNTLINNAPGRRFAHSEKTLNKYKNALYSQFLINLKTHKLTNSTCGEGETRTPDSVPDYSAFAPFICRFPSPCSAAPPHCSLIAFPGSQDRTRRQASFYIAKFPIAPSDYEGYMWALSTSSRLSPGAESNRHLTVTTAPAHCSPGVSEGAVPPQVIGLRPFKRTPITQPLAPI